MTTIVTNEAGLDAAIDSANQGNAVVVTFAGNITETTALDGLDAANGGSLTINGGGFYLSGGAQFQGLYDYNSASGAAAPASPNLIVNNLTIENATAQGQAGSGGAGGGGGGGGGAGLGGGLYVANGANVLLTNVQFTGDSAAGGNGGGESAGENGAGGSGAPATTTGAGQNGSAQGTGGTGGGLPGGEGGGGNGSGPGGGGGVGAGGDIFVQTGGVLTILGGVVPNGTANGGSGVGSSSAGDAGGQGILIESGQTLTIAASASSGAAVISGVIGDANSVVSGTGAGGGVVIGQSGSTGLVEFAAVDTYTGATNVAFGTLLLTPGASIATSSGVAVASGAALDVSLTGGTVSVSNLSGAGQVELGSATLNVVETATGAGSVFSGVISDGGMGGGTYASGSGGKLEVSAGAATPGPLTLTGVNTYNGATTIVSGTLALGVGGSIAASSAVAVANGATFDISSAGAGVTINNLEDSGTITGAGTGAVNLGPNTLNVEETGAATFSGVISGAGTLIVDGPTGPGSKTAGATGALTLNNTEAVTGHVQVYGTLELGPDGDLSSAKNIALKASGAVFDVSATEGTSINNLVGATGSLVDLGAATLSVDQSTAATFAGVIQNANVAGGNASGGGLTVEGSAPLTLAGAAETYIGATTITGDLALGAGGSIAASAAVKLSGNGTFNITNAGGGVTVQNLQDLSSGNPSTNASVVLGSNNLTVEQGATTTTTFSGVISGAGNLIVDGPTGTSASPGTGALILNNAEAITGHIQDYGTLELGANGNLSTAQNVALKAAGAVFDISATGASGAAINNLVSGTSSSVDLGAATLTVTQNTAAIFAGVIQNADVAGENATGGGLTVEGTKFLTLSGANTYVGATTLAATMVNGSTMGGSLALSGTGSIQSSVRLVMASDTTFDISGATAQVNVNNLQDSGSGSTGAMVLLGANTLNVEQTGLTTFSGVIADSGLAGGTGGNLTVNGTVGSATDTGTLVLATAATYTGATLINAGTLALTASSGHFGSIADSSGVTLAANSTFNLSELDNGSDSIIKSLSSTSSTSTVSLGYTTLEIQGVAAVGNAPATPNTTFAGRILNGFGYGGLTLNEASATQSLTLSGANSYSGATLIEAGTLALSGTGTIADSSSMTIDGATSGPGGTLDISQTTSGATVSQLAGAGTVALGAEVLTVVQQPSLTTFSGVIQDAGIAMMAASGGGMTPTNGGGLTVNSSGVNGGLILTGTNTYTGATTIGANALLQLGDGGTTGTINSTSGVADGGTLVFDLSTTSTSMSNPAMPFTPLISGAGGVTQAGTGTTTLVDAETYSGVTEITAGTLALGMGGSISESTALKIASGGTFDISGAGDAAVNNLQDLNLAAGAPSTASVVLGQYTLDVETTGATTTFSGVISGTSNEGALVLNGAGASGTLILAGANTYTGLTSIDAGELQLGNGGAAGSIASAVAISSGASLAFDNSGMTTFGQIISGAGELIQMGAGTTTLTAADTYTGETLISSGTLAIGSGGSIAGSTEVVVANGMTAATFDISAAGGGVTVQDLMGASSGVVKLGSNALTVEESGTTTFSGQINGAGSLLVDGPTSASPTSPGATGTLILDGANGLTGHVQVYGTLDLGLDGSISAASNVALKTSGAVFDISATADGASIGNLIGAAGSSVDLGGSTLTVHQGVAATYAGMISGEDGALTVEAAANGTAAALTLTGANTYTGVTTIDGHLALAGTGSIAESSVMIGSGGALDISNASSSVLINGLNGSGNLELGGSSLTLNETGTDNFSGLISDTGGVGGGTGGSLVLEGGGTLNLSGTSTYTGGTVLEGGDLHLSAMGAAGTGSILFASASELLIDTSALGGTSTAETFSNRIDGFSAAGDTIDLTGLTFSSAMQVPVSGGMLTVTEGSDSVSLHLTGFGTGGSVQVMSDGHTGTLIYDPALHG